MSFTVISVTASVTFCPLFQCVKQHGRGGRGLELKYILLAGFEGLLSLSVFHCCSFSFSYLPFYLSLFSFSPFLQLFFVFCLFALFLPWKLLLKVNFSKALGSFIFTQLGVSGSFREDFIVIDVAMYCFLLRTECSGSLAVVLYATVCPRSLDHFHIVNYNI